MGKYALNSGKRNPFWRNQIVHDAHAALPHDGQLEIHQVVVILVHRPSQSILDWHGSARCPASFDGAENVFEAGARHHRDFWTGQSPGGLFAEGPALALESDGPGSGTATHFAGPSHLRTPASGIPIRSSTLSTL